MTSKEADRRYKERRKCGGLFRRHDIYVHPDDWEHIKLCVEDLRDKRLSEKEGTLFYDHIKNEWIGLTKNSVKFKEI